MSTRTLQFAVAVTFLLLTGCGNDEAGSAVGVPETSGPVDVEILVARIPPAPAPGTPVTPFDNISQAYFEVRFTNTGSETITRLNLRFEHPRIRLANQTMFSQNDPLRPGESKTRQFNIDLLDTGGESDVAVSVVDWVTN